MDNTKLRSSLYSNHEITPMTSIAYYHHDGNQVFAHQSIEIDSNTLRLELDANVNNHQFC